MEHLQYKFRCNRIEHCGVMGQNVMVYKIPQKYNVHLIPDTLNNKQVASSTGY